MARVGRKYCLIIGIYISREWLTLCIVTNVTITEFIIQGYINPLIPKNGTAKHIAHKFIADDNKPILNINNCSPNPFKTADIVTCVYIKGQRTANILSIAPICLWE